MSARKKTGLAVLGLIVLAMLALGGYEFREFRAPKECGFCRRPLQQKLRVVVEIGGQRREACCPQCAVSESRQEHKPVRLTPPWHSQGRGMRCTLAQIGYEG